MSTAEIGVTGEAGSMASAALWMRVDIHLYFRFPQLFPQMSISAHEMMVALATGVLVGWCRPRSQPQTPTKEGKALAERLSEPFLFSMEHAHIRKAKEQMGEWTCQLREVRMNAGLSLKAVAAASGVHISTISRTERTGVCRLSHALKLAHCFGITVEKIWVRKKGGPAC